MSQKQGKMSEKTLQNEVARQVRATDARVESFAFELQTWIRVALAEILADIEGQEDNALANLGALMQSLEAKGLGAEINKIGAIYGQELRQALKQAQIDGLLVDDLVKIDAQTAEAFIRFKVEEVQATIYKEVGSLRPILLQSIILDQPFEISQLSETISARAASNVKTEMNTGLMMLNRTVTLVQAEETGVTEFLYVGPNDAKTRPFCENLLDSRSPPIYTKAEIEGMSNGQGLTVSQAAGGYNCRHHWRPVSEKVKERLKRYE